METYKIVRFYKEDRPPDTIKEGLTLAEAKEHCKDDDTEQDGVYFDGYTTE